MYPRLSQKVDYLCCLKKSGLLYEIEKSVCIKPIDYASSSIYQLVYCNFYRQCFCILLSSID